MEANGRVSIHTSADKVWKILDTDFGKIDTWAVRMLQSRSDDSLGELGGRVVNTIEYGEAFETIIKRNDAERAIGYKVEAEGIPAVLEDVKTVWRVEDTGDDETVVHIAFVATLKDEAMGEMLSQQLASGINKLLDQLKYFAENDEPHPDKLAQLAGD